MKSVVVGIIMGSDSDLAVMSDAAKVLDEFGIGYEIHVVSAHRTPELMEEYAKTSQKRGLKIIIAGAGGSAHLPGMTASHTVLPVIAVPVKKDNHDHEALWSNVKMPPGIPLATMPENGAKNAALLCIEILSLSDESLCAKYIQFRNGQNSAVKEVDRKLNELGWAEYLKGVK